MHLTPLTADPAVARTWFERFEGAGLDGVVAKAADLAYLPGQRAMWKVKHERTGDFVVAGFRWYQANPEVVGSLMLGLYDGARLQHVGVIGAFPAAQRRAAGRRAGALPSTPTTIRGPTGPVAAADAADDGRRLPGGGEPLERRQGPQLRVCSGPTWWSRLPSSTCRASGCGTRPASAAGVPIGIRAAAPTTRWT